MRAGYRQNASEKKAKANRIVSAEPPIVPRKGGLPNGPMPQSAGLGLARVAAEIPAVERGTWFDMCPGRGANNKKGLGVIP
jgi:hypothetical protein